MISQCLFMALLRHKRLVRFGASELTLSWVRKGSVCSRAVLGAQALSERVHRHAIQKEHSSKI
jgi:hypothetical protein